MTSNQLLSLITQLTVILIAVRALYDYLRHRDQTRFDVLLLFGSLGLIVIQQWISMATAGQISWLGRIGSILLMAHPYLILRLVRHLRPVPGGLRWFAWGGLLVSWIVILVFPPPMPGILAALLVVYFIVVDGYAAWALIAGARNSSGVTHGRLMLTAYGSGLIGLLLFIAGINAVAPSVARYLSPFSQLVGLGCVVCYYLGFMPPSRLRRSWQIAELYRFLKDSSTAAAGEATQHLLARLCASAERSVGGRVAYVALWDAQREGLVPVAASEPGEEFPPAWLENAALHQIYQENRPDFITLPASQPASTRSSEAPERAMVVPIYTRERVYGLLAVLLTHEPLFVSDDLELLNLFSEQVAINLGYVELLKEQQGLIEQLQRYNHRLEAVNEIDRAILAARSPEEVASAAISHLRRLVPSQRASMVLFDYERQEGRYIAADADFSFGPQPGSVYSLQEFPPMQYAQRDVIYIQDLENHPTTTKLMKDMLGYGIHSMVFAPLVAEGQVIGELALKSKDVNGFTVEHRQVAREVANQLAIAIQQARLRVELQRYADELEQRVEERTVQLQNAVENLQAEIAARKQASEALRAAQQRLQFLLSATPAIIYSAKADGSFIANFVSENVSAQLGYESWEFLADPNFWLDRVHPEDLPRLQSSLSAGAPREKIATEYRFQHKDGSYRWMRDEARLVVNSQGRPAEYVGYWIDISERKTAEEAVKKLNEDLEQRAQELSAANHELEAFAYSVSHDLRAPLRAIDGFSRVLLTRFADGLPEEGQRYLALVRNNTHQMGQLIDDLLTFSRLSRQPLNRQLIDPTGIVRVVLKEQVKDQADHKVEVNLYELPPCHSDPTLLKQVFVNLVSNALKFSSKREVSCIEVGCKQEGAEPVYYVKDNGVGFDMQYAHKLFGVFQRLHRADEFDGTGVGLAIVQRIVNRHGGRVWAEAELDKGATFYFTLPAPV